MTPARQTWSLEQIKDMLLAQVTGVVDRYAPPAKGSFTDRQGRFFTLNPGRVDRSVGSFWVETRGAKAGKWQDKATGEHGDILDLIRLSLGCSAGEALAEARRYLGLQAVSHEDRRRMEQQAARAKARRAEAEKQARADKAARSAAAFRLWLSGREDWRGTPADLYLHQARRIDLGRLGRAPRALRYLPGCRYRHVDQDTGEIVEGTWPALVGVIVDGRGRAIACHRIFLGLDRQGRWNKAPVTKPRMALGDYAGGAINLWRGLAEDSRRPPRLSECPPGSHVYVTEGIEDALAGILLVPDGRWLCAVSLSNFGQVPLPPNVSAVTLVADRDWGAEAQAALQRAVGQHQEAGREVRVWLNQDGGKDLNDALIARLKAQQEGTA